MKLAFLHPVTYPMEMHKYAHLCTRICAAELFIIAKKYLIFINSRSDK